MSQPARLTGGLLPSRKGEAAPVTLAPAAAPEPAGSMSESAVVSSAASGTLADVRQEPAASPSSRPAPRERAGVAPKPPAAPTALMRAPAPDVPRQNLSVRLPIDMVEWLRVQAFVSRSSIQQIVEDAITAMRTERGE